MKKIFIFTIISIVTLVGCTNEFKFRAQNVGEETPSPQPPGNEPTGNPDVGSPKPEEPVIVDPDRPTVYPVVYKQGECTKDPFDVLPCLSCQISQRPIDVPLSTKGMKLLRIMEQGCHIRNKSDPKGYVPPTRSDLLRLISRASVSMYPESTMTLRQKIHLGYWADGNQDYLEELFGGFWYNPPYSDDFETYFGIEPREARYLFCYGTPEGSFSTSHMGPMHSMEYMDCVSRNFPYNCREEKVYETANIYRKQLFDSIQLSLKDPFNDQEMVPSNKCHWHSMSGFYNIEMESKLVEWRNTGYEIAVYFERDNPRCEKSNQSLISLGSKVTIAAKKCESF